MPTRNHLANAIKAGQPLKCPNAITFLKQQVDKAKLSPELRHYTDSLFRPYLRTYEVSHHQAQHIAIVISCYINWARSQQKLLDMDPQHQRYLSVSKVVSQWAANSLKFNKTNGKLKREPGARVPFPRTPVSDDDNETDNASTGL